MKTKTDSWTTLSGALAWLRQYRENHPARKRDKRFYQRTRIRSSDLWISGTPIAGSPTLWENKSKAAFVFDCPTDAENFIATCLRDLPRETLHVIADPPKDELAVAIRKARRKPAS